MTYFLKTCLARPKTASKDRMRYAEANKICFLSIKGHQIYELKYYITQEKEHGVTLRKGSNTGHF